MQKAVIAAVLLCLAPSARAQELSAVATCSHRESDGARTLCHETVVSAPPDAVWRLFSTTEGLSSWVAPVAAIDLRVGGIWEASYRMDARLGDQGNIRNRVLSYLPHRMLSIAVDSAPPGFPHPELVQGVWTVIELEQVGEMQTRVRVSMLGYREGADYDELYQMFDQGNAFTLRKLAERVSNGRTNWQNTAAIEQRP